MQEVFRWQNCALDNPLIGPVVSSHWFKSLRDDNWVAKRKLGIFANKWVSKTRKIQASKSPADIKRD